MCYLGLTLYFRVACFVQLEEHGLKGFDRFIIALFAMKCCMLQLVSKVRMRVEFYHLRTQINLGYLMDRCHRTFRASSSASFHSILPSSA